MATNLIQRDHLDALETRCQLRARLARLEEIQRLLDAEPIETDFLYDPGADTEGPLCLQVEPGEPVVIYWRVVDRWIEAAIKETRRALQSAELHELIHTTPGAAGRSEA